MGLLLSHKSTVRIYPDMVTVSENRDRSHGGGGKRNEIEGFSRGSRYRLFRLLHSLRFSTVSFVTLTYGQTFPTNGRIAKIHLKAFRRATERRWGNLSAIWRMEFQRRGAPHFHILYLDAPWIPVEDWCLVWDRSRHAPNGERSRNSLDLKINRETKGSDVVGKYLGKYIAKPTQENDSEEKEKWGRVWGKWNIEEPKPLEVELYPFEVEKLYPLLFPPGGPQHWEPENRESYTVFGSTMGKEDFGTDVLWRVKSLLSYTRKPEGERGKMLLESLRLVTV